MQHLLWYKMSNKFSPYWAQLLKFI